MHCSNLQAHDVPSMTINMWLNNPSIYAVYTAYMPCAQHTQHIYSCEKNHDYRTKTRRVSDELFGPQAVVRVANFETQLVVMCPEFS